MIKAIIFDLDGTLLDTSRDIQKVLNNSLAKFSLPTLSLEKTIEYVGDGAKKLIERAVGGCTNLVEEVYADYVVNFVNCDNNLTTLFNKEAETLQKFKDYNIKLAIISNKPQGATERVYAKFLSKFDFCEVLGQTEHYPLKPNPASTLAIISKLGVNKDDCLYVGDGDADVITAKGAGIRCVSALWGFRSREQLEKAGATEFALNFVDLGKIVFENF